MFWYLVRTKITKTVLELWLSSVTNPMDRMSLNSTCSHGNKKIKIRITELGSSRCSGWSVPNADAQAVDEDLIPSATIYPHTYTNTYSVSHITKIRVFWKIWVFELCSEQERWLTQTQEQTRSWIAFNVVKVSENKLQLKSRCHHGNAEAKWLIYIWVPSDENTSASGYPRVTLKSLE